MAGPPAVLSAAFFPPAMPPVLLSVLDRAAVEKSCCTVASGKSLLACSCFLISQPPTMTDIEAPPAQAAQQQHDGDPLSRPQASEATAPPAPVLDARPPSAERLRDRAAASARRIALLLLSGGADSLRLIAALAARLLLRLGASLRSGAPSAAALAAKALAGLAQLLRPVSRPLAALLSQLVSLQLRLTANEDEGDAVAGQLASLRLHSCLALLFGAVRLRSHTCLQLGMPSRHHPLPSLASPRPAGDSAAAAAASGGSGSSRPAKQQAEAQPQPRAGGTGADTEVHVLCSAELRTAILSFLQHASSTTGEEWVLLRNTTDGGGDHAAPQQQASTHAAGAGTQEGGCSTDQQRALAHAMAGAGGPRSSGSSSAVATWGQALVAAGLTQSWPGPGAAAAAPAASPSSLGRSPCGLAAPAARCIARRASMGDDPAPAPSAPLLLGGDALVGVRLGEPQHGGSSPTVGAKAWQQQQQQAWRGGASFAGDTVADASLTSLAALCRSQHASSSGGCSTGQAAAAVEAAHPLAANGAEREQQQGAGVSGSGGLPDCVPSSPRCCASPGGLATRQAQGGGSPAAKKKLPAAPLLAPPGTLAASDTAGLA